LLAIHLIKELTICLVIFENLKILAMHGVIKEALGFNTREHQGLINGALGFNIREH